MNLIHLPLFATLLVTSGSLLGGEPIDETRDVASDAVIDIEIAHGTVTLTGWDRNQFRIVGELSDDAEGYELDVLNDGIRFEEDLDRDSHRNCWSWWGCDQSRGEQTSVEIQVPRNSLLTFEGINVELSISGLHGSTQVELINGELQVSDLRGVVALKTVNGSISADALDGRLTLETVNGSIVDSNSTGSRVSYNTVNGSITSNVRSQRLKAGTVNGDMDLNLATVDELELSTVSGTLEVNTALGDMAQVDMSSVGGRIELVLPAATSARFNVRTAVGGRITNQLSADEAVRENRFINSSELRFPLNGGRADVRISTVSGDVSLRSQ